MLVLSRKQGEKLLIGDNVVITIVEIRKHIVRLGVDAPREVDILRPDAVNTQKRIK